MGNPANLSGALPAGDANGLAAIAKQLVEHPRRMHVIVALVDTKSIRKDVDDDTMTATVRVRRIEVITDPADRDAMRWVLMRHFERRTGQTVLPFELETAIRQAFEPDDHREDTP